MIEIMPSAHTSDMDFKQLKAFLTVAETGNVTRAAQLLNIVQPAVSRQLKLLEDDVGTALFERDRRGMRLTDAGKMLEVFARRVLDELARAKAEIQPLDGNAGGMVTVGLLPSVADMLSGMLLRAVKQRYPGIRLRITSGYAGHQQQWLEHGDVDLALLYQVKPNAAFKTQVLLEENLWLVGPAGSGLQPDTLVHMRDALEHGLVLPSPPHGLRTLVEQAASAQDMHLRIVAETNAMSVQKRLVFEGMGYTVLPPAAVADDVARGVLAAAPLSAPDLLRRIVLGTPNNRPLTTSMRCVMSELLRCTQEAVATGGWPSARWLGK